uniref:Uncharacterized protein n=1 Tax=Heterosigma akashiwo TaxID=2829 RepID=A0A7S3XLS1_HETAK
MIYGYTILLQSFLILLLYWSVIALPCQQIPPPKKKGESAAPTSNTPLPPPAPPALPLAQHAGPRLSLHLPRPPAEEAKSGRVQRPVPGSVCLGVGPPPRARRQ